MEESHIYVTSFPYFEKFIPVSDKRPEKYNNALILPLDYYGNAPQEKLSAKHEYINNVIHILNGLRIKIIGIKARGMYAFRKLGIKEDYIEYEGNKYELLSGYTSFPEAAREADIIIGPASTAIIEAALLGKDYYVYSHYPFHEKVASVLPAMYQILNAAFSIEQLRQNILNKQPFKAGYSVFDLVDLKGVRTKEDVYSKFERAIIDIINSE